MLERTAGCLESGSLRRLLPGSKKALKSRRELHSGFWNHGATEIEFSPLWAALIRGPDSLDESCEQEHKTSTEPGGMLLAFLYPAGTIRFLRQCSGWTIDRQDGRRSTAGFAKLGHRLYTSSAKDYFASHQEVEVTVDAEDSSDKEASAEYLQNFLHLELLSDFEEAWRRYSLLDNSKQQRMCSHMIQYFFASNRVVDAERTTELFKKLQEGCKQQTAYIAAIRADLRLQNLSHAVMLNQVALGKFGFPVGADRLLVYMFEKSLWSRAVETWQQFRNFQTPSLQVPYDILELVYRSPARMGQALALAEFVTSRRETFPNDLENGLPEPLEFASKIVKHLLFTEPTWEQPKLNRLLEALRCWGLDTPDVYQTYLQRLLQNSNDSEPAVQLYRKARRIKEVKFSRWVLHGLLRIFCDHHSIKGMQQILDDFFRCHGRPSRRTYQLCMREFASQGDADTVHALFDQYAKRFQAVGTVEMSANEFAPLLHVHAIRGELATVLKVFTDIQDHYKLKPTILCWNIVLNAHGVAHDIDSAFEWFDRLLETTALQPDDYTFGTMMGICATKGDRERAVELYRLAGSMGIEKSTSMIDTLVLTFLKDEYLTEAEKTCEDSLKLSLKGSRTRMWNHLLVAYALRRDLPNVNRLLKRMSDVKVDYDQFTYSALMLALVMVHQPDRAKAIMTEVMEAAGVKPTNIHYAVLMGGYLANREFHKVFVVRKAMRKRRIKDTESSRLLVIKAAAAENQKFKEIGTNNKRSQRALQIFQDTISSTGSLDFPQSVTKGMGKLPRDIAYSSMLNSFITFVLSQQDDELKTVGAVYDQYIKTLPENRRDSPPNQILSALMISKERAHDFKGAQECWDMAFTQAKEQGRNPRIYQTSSTQLSNIPKILPDHQLDLTELLTTQMISLSRQKRTEDIPPLIDSLLEEGFLLDNNNWNHYIQLMARRYRYKLAFKLCETHLMPNWTGWARIRWQAPERNRLPIELRNLRKRPKHYRPKAHTLLYLARGYLELQSMATESPASQMMLAELERDCPKTILAIRTMQRADNPLERDILRDYIV